ncbi:hypothetical protein SprV_0301281800 [Sparganum proliferum]
MYFIHTAVALLAFCSFALPRKYTGQYPRSKKPVDITVRVPFSPVEVIAGGYYQYVANAFSNDCVSRQGYARCSLSPVGPGLYEFHFNASSTENIPYVDLERSQFERVTAFRTPLQKATQDFALSPYHSAPLVHYPTDKRHYVDVKCAVKVPTSYPELSINVYENGTQVCSYANGSHSGCQKAFYNPRKQMFILKYRVQKKTLNPTEYRFILCTSRSSWSINFLSHYIEFHNSK